MTVGALSAGTKVGISAPRSTNITGVERHTSTHEIARIEVARYQVGLGHSGGPASLTVVGGFRGCSGAPRRSCEVGIRDRPTTPPNGAHDSAGRRRRYRHTCAHAHHKVQCLQYKGDARREQLMAIVLQSLAHFGDPTLQLHLRVSAPVIIPWPSEICRTLTRLIISTLVPRSTDKLASATREMDGSPPARHLLSGQPSRP
jgi:hypothetical protein